LTIPYLYAKEVVNVCAIVFLILAILFISSFVPSATLFHFDSINKITSTNDGPYQQVFATKTLDCSDVDSSKYGRCDTDIDRKEKGYKDCYVSLLDPLCISLQKTSVKNSLSSSEEAKISMDIEQLLRCGNQKCVNQSNDPNVDGQPESLLVATQEVNVESKASSKADFDVDFEIEQKSNGKGQNNMFQDNIANQKFLILADDHSAVDADGRGKDVQFEIKQKNDRCNNTSCFNTANQGYNFIAADFSEIDVSSNTGLKSLQKNNGCDDNDGDFTIECSNVSNQILSIAAIDSAFVKYDSLGSNDAFQTNNCDFGIFGCKNSADTTVAIGSTGTSVVNLDNTVQDVKQTNTCVNLNSNGINNGDDKYGCLNIASVNLAALSAEDGRINGMGSQTAIQSNSCDNADCKNVADLLVGFGLATDATNPVEGTLNMFYTQNVMQSNQCNLGSNCVNFAQVWDFGFADDDAVVNSAAYQKVAQTNTCSTNQNCANIGLVINNAFGADSAQVTGVSSQSLTQSCNSLSGPNCININTVVNSGRGVNDVVLNYATVQNIDSPTDGSGTASITISRESGTETLQPIFQFQNGDICRIDGSSICP
jgi:hypothetical protein